MAEKPPRRPFIFIVEGGEGAAGDTNRWFVEYMSFYTEWLENFESGERFLKELKDKELIEMPRKDWSPEKQFIHEFLEKSFKGHNKVVVVQNLKEILLMAEHEAEVPYYIPINIPSEIAAEIRAFASDHGIKEAPPSFIEAAVEKKVFYNGPRS